MSTDFNGPRGINSEPCSKPGSDLTNAGVHESFQAVAIVIAIDVVDEERFVSLTPFDIFKDLS